MKRPARSATRKKTSASATTAKPAPKKAPAPPPRPDPDTLEVKVYPAPVLRQRGKAVGELDPWVQAVIAKMKKLMVAHRGVGLAAPQVGLSLRLFVWSPTGTEEEAQAIVNPVLSQERGVEEGEEGCLSLPEIHVKVARAKYLHVEGTDEQGRPVSLDLEDYPARIVQHETDHLDGVLILDRMSPLAKLANRRKIKELEEKAGE